MKRRPHVLVTGRPGVGKTTLMKRIIEELRHREVKLAGFYTEELRREGMRTGFSIVSISGRVVGMLASVHGTSPLRIGKYAVDEGPLKDFVRQLAISIEGESVDVLIIDEIGPMELCSPDFKQFIMEALSRDHPPVMGTIKKGTLDLLKVWSVSHRVRTISISEADRSAFGSMAEKIAAGVHIERRGEKCG